MKEEFKKWWDGPDTARHITNKFHGDTAKYWAYEGWVRGMRFAIKSIREENRLDRIEKRKRYAENKAARGE